MTLRAYDALFLQTCIMPVNSNAQAEVLRSLMADIVGSSNTSQPIAANDEKITAVHFTPGGTVDLSVKSDGPDHLPSLLRDHSQCVYHADAMINVLNTHKISLTLRAQGIQ